MRGFPKQYLLLAIFLIWPPGYTEGNQTHQGGTTAKAVLIRMAQNYARLTSYQDEGVVLTTYDEKTGGRVQEQPFKTFFRKPMRFRFQWIDYSPRKEGELRVVWSNGKDAFTCWQPDKFEKDADLHFAIAGASGVSSGAAHRLFRFLVKGASGFALTELIDTTLARDEEFEGDLCYHIRGKHPSGNAYELWISKSDHFIRKIRTEAKLSHYTIIEEEIHRSIKVNQLIRDGVFEFNPPIALSPKQPGQRAEESELLLDQSTPWVEFASDEGRFRLLLPAKPEAQTLTLETRSGRVVHHGFVAAKGTMVCLVDFADLPKELAQPDKAKALFDEARDAFLKETQAKLASETSISIGGHPGREIKVALYGGEAQARFYLVNDRFYQLAITIFARKSKSLGEIEKFFGSFKVIAETKTVAETH